MLNGLGMVFFMLLALVLVGTYLAIRREWFSPGVIAGVSIVASIILMVLTSLGQGNSAIQAIVVGIVVGGIFSGVTVGTAWYFHSQDMQQRPIEGSDENYIEEGYAESD
jgi:Na+/H+-translocating membrane pyrophosphatase